MITLRFEQHNSGSYAVYFCCRYSVSVMDGTDPEARKKVVRMHRTPDDDNPYYEQVGDYEPYGTCYVMNDIGKTVDIIRSG